MATMTSDPQTAISPAAESNATPGLIHIANIAGGAYHPAEMAAGAIVAMPTERPPTGNGLRPVETEANTKRHTCEYCGGDFIPLRASRRFCNANCRRLAWLDRNPEKAAAIAEKDRQRLRDHVIGCGGVWVDYSDKVRCENGC